MININILLALLAGLGLGVIHIASPKIVKNLDKGNFHLLSMVTGYASILYVLLLLLPEELGLINSPSIFLTILIGFSIFHLGHEYLCPQLNEEGHKIKPNRLHLGGYFLSFFIIGLGTIEIFELFSVIAILFVLILAAKIILAGFSFAKIKKSYGFGAQVLLSLSSFIGLLAGAVIDISRFGQEIIIAFFIGLLLYVGSRSLLIKKQKL